MGKDLKLQRVNNFEVVARSTTGDWEIERLVLGAFLTTGRASMGRYMGVVQEHWFQDSLHKRVFRVLRDMYDGGLDIDMTILINRLSSLEEWQVMDDPQGRLEILLEQEIVLTNIDNYIELLAEKFRLRKALAVFTDYWRQLNHDVTRANPKITSVETITKIQAALGAIKAEGAVGRPTNLVTCMESLEEKRNDIIAKQQKYTGITSGITSLDEMTLGFQRGDEIIMGARSSMGKTGAVISIARHIAKTYTDDMVHIESIEMNNEAITLRWLSQETGISIPRLRCPMYLNEKELDELSACKNQIAANVSISDRQLSIDEMIGNWYRLADKKQLSAIILDYVQLQAKIEEAKTGLDLRKAVSKVSVNLKEAAKQLNVPVIGLSQIKREVEDRENKRPTMSDLAEAAFEADADVIILLYRHAYYANKSLDPSAEKIPNNRMELIVDKQRNGPTGTITVFFDENTASIKNLDFSLMKQVKMNIVSDVGNLLARNNSEGGN